MMRRVHSQRTQSWCHWLAASHTAHSLALARILTTVSLLCADTAL
jgi:hypothetical protein